jgi:hypothetical protein
VKGRRIAWAAVVLALGAPAARGALLAAEGQLAIDVRGVRVEVAGSGAANVATTSGGALGGLALPAGFLLTSDLTAEGFGPADLPFAGLRLTAANGAGAFARPPGGALGGALPIVGILRICLFSACHAGPAANLSVPLAPVGAGGAEYGTANQPTTLFVTVVGAPWTTATVTASGGAGPRTAMGFVHGPASAPGSAAQTGGALQLVTPVLVHHNIGVDGPEAVLASLRLRLVPEPVAALPVAAGVLALLAAGRACLRPRPRSRMAARGKGTQCGEPGASRSP